MVYNAKSLLLSIFSRYIQRLYNKSKLDLFAYLSQLKYAMEVEYKICKSQNNENKFAKYNFVYENL